MQDDTFFRHAIFRVPQVAAWLYRGSLSGGEGELYSMAAKHFVHSELHRRLLVTMSTQAGKFCNPSP